MNHSRRVFLKGVASAGVISLAAAAGLLRPARALANVWPTEAFDSETVDGALNALFETTESSPSEAIMIKAPDIAENGAVVPITVETEMANVESITIIAQKNPAPLSAKFDLAANAKPYVSTRIKMGETSNVTALVKADGKLYSASKEVKVTIGGCGG